MSAPALAVVPSKTPIERNTPLLIGGYFSLAFAVFQISGIFWPVSGIRYFGGPADLRADHFVWYALLCLVVGIAVGVFGIYALSGAGKIRPLKWLRTTITGTTAIYLLRGLLLFTQAAFIIKHPVYWRFALFSLIALAVGVVHLIGLIKLFKYGRPGEAS